MAIFGGLKQALQDQYIARPADASGALIWRFSNQNIVDGAQVTVRSDEEALFFRDGRLVGRLQAGSHTLATKNIPWLSDLLLAPLTGGNQFIAELYFVRLAPTRSHLNDESIGVLRDLASGIPVEVRVTASFALEVVDPVALVIQLGGQDASSAQRATAFLNARLMSVLRSQVGKMAERTPILSLISNAYSEDVGQLVRSQIEPEFLGGGLRLASFLDLRLHLDAVGAQQLSAYGAQQAELQISRQGAQIAQDPGFQAFQLAQGQRAALEGLGKGLAEGNVHTALMGMPFGLGAMPPPMRRAELAPLPPNLRGSGPAGGHALRPPVEPLTFMVRSTRGEEGPYRARQVALRLLADKLDPRTTLVRGTDDASWFPAAEEPEIRAEWERRVPAERATGPQTSVEFESLWEVAAADRLITLDELNLLVRAALRLQVATNEAEARQMLTTRAAAAGCQLEGRAEATTRPEPPGRSPPPVPVVLYRYSDGVHTSEPLTAAAVAERVQQRLAAEHWVWREGWSEWRRPGDVAEIKQLLP